MRSASETNEVLGVIPARGGSKGVPGKNIRDFNGRPLIAYSIDAAKSSKTLDKFIVSTDSEEIAAVAREYGAEVPFLRPAELGGDGVPTMKVLAHALDFLEGEGTACDTVVCLQPTSPFRTSRHIDEAVELYSRNPGRALASVCPVAESPSWMVTVEGDVGTAFVEGGWSHTSRQDLPPLFRLNGAVYVLPSELVREGGSLPERITVYRMTPEESVDIDSELDWRLAVLLARGEA